MRSGQAPSQQPGRTATALGRWGTQLHRSSSCTLTSALWAAAEPLCSSFSESCLPKAHGDMEGARDISWHQEKTQLSTYTLLYQTSWAMVMRAASNHQCLPLAPRPFHSRFLGNRLQETNSLVSSPTAIGCSGSARKRGQSELYTQAPSCLY